MKMSALRIAVSTLISSKNSPRDLLEDAVDRKRRRRKNWFRCGCLPRWLSISKLRGAGGRRGSMGRCWKRSRRGLKTRLKLRLYFLLLFRPEPSGYCFTDVRKCLRLILALTYAAGQFQALGDNPTRFVCRQDGMEAHQEFLSVLSYFPATRHSLIPKSPCAIDTIQPSNELYRA